MSQFRYVGRHAAREQSLHTRLGARGGDGFTRARVRTDAERERLARGPERIEARGRIESHDLLDDRLLLATIRSSSASGTSPRVTGRPRTRDSSVSPTRVVSR